MNQNKLIFNSLKIFCVAIILTCFCIETKSFAKTLYSCGMHPNVIQEEPGICPICKMDLTILKNANNTEMLENLENPNDKKNSQVILVDPVMVQNMGVRIEHVKQGEVFKHIRTIGEVDVAEDEVSVVNLRFSGWIENIWVDETGQKVEKGQSLFEIYSPELVSAQEEYLLAVKTEGKQSNLAKSASQRLQLWNIPESHIKQILKPGNTQKKIIIKAPKSGYVLHKNVVLGARINAGEDLYRIGNLKKIWVNAEVYEFDAPWIRLGQRATMELSFQKGKLWKGRVSYIYPTLNKKSRTLKVRLEFSNPGIVLKPGMFATIRIKAKRKKNVLYIPSEAIIHSGERQIVFVTEEIGKYMPKQIVTGLVGDNFITEVISGLEKDEAVVTSGQFLLDSESQIQEAIQKLLSARLQVKKKNIQNLDSINEHKHDHNTENELWICPMHPNIIQEEFGTCPICKMDLVLKK